MVGPAAIDVAYAPPKLHSSANADRCASAYLSLVFKLAFRKFECEAHSQNLPIKNPTARVGFFIGGPCKTRTCDQTVMSGLL